MTDPFVDSTSQLLSRGMIKTSSRLRKAWLSMFRGYDVVKRMKTPKGYSLGRLTYITSWVLQPRSRE